MRPDPAVLAWAIAPILVVHLLAFRRGRRALQAFQLLADAGIALLVGPITAAGHHTGPGLPAGSGWGAEATVSGSPEQVDLPAQFTIYWEEVRRLAREGEPPWISDRLGGGATLYANGQSGVPFPGQLPVWVLGARRGTDVMAVWKLELAALFGFLLLRRLGVRSGPAGAGALAYAFGLYHVSWLVVPLAWVVAATPAAFWALVGTLRGRRRDAAILALLLGALAGWSTHPETAAFLMLAVFLSGSILGWGRWRRLRRLVAPLVLSLSISAVGAVPTLLTIRGSAKLQAWTAHGRPNYPTPGFTNEHRAFLAAHLAAPWLHGSPADGTWGQGFPAAAVALGVGTIPLVLILSGTPRRRHRRQALAALGVLGLAAALVFQLPVVAHVLARVPFLGVMLWVRAGFLLGFALAVLGALAADAWCRRARAKSLLGAALAVQLAIASLYLAAPRDRRPALSPAAAAPAALAVLSAAGSGAWLPLAVLLEQAILSRGLLASAGPEPPSALVQELRRLSEREDGRVLCVGPMLPPNLAAGLGLRDLVQNDPVRPARLALLHELLGSSGMDLAGPVTRPRAGLAGAWGVAWAVAPPAGIPPPFDAGWEEVWRDSSGVLYRNARRLPRVRVAVHAEPASEALLESLDYRDTAFAEGSPDLGGAGSMELLEERPWRVRARVRAEGRVLAVLHVPLAPGWRAFLDGSAAPIVPANVAAMGVLVRDGTHEVEWRYTPPGLLLGATLTLLGLAACAALAAGRGLSWRGPGRPRAPSPPA